jgi:hypothetical protein
MHPVITQAIAAERGRELHAQAAAARRARHLRRSRHGGRTWRFTRLLHGERVPALLPAARPLRGPRPAPANRS